MLQLRDPDRLERAYQTARAALLAERTQEGHWVGELSTSALSTAVAVSALSLVQKHTKAHGSFDALIEGGLRWLVEHQNADGGWGDTVKSFSNISTTMLCRAAFHITRGVRAGSVSDGGPSPHPSLTLPARIDEALSKCESWLAARYGRTPEELAEAVRARYSKDRTFSVPILMTSALAGLVSWKEVPSLPFELACFPQSMFRFLGLPVVSYALPALIAIGQAVYHHRKPWNPLARLARWMGRGKSLRVLQKIQPSNGGFLEAAPLTAFVTLGLASIGKADHPVVAKAVDFLVKSVRPDGSWPIDTNLSTWVTTLAINALAAAGDLASLDKRDEVRDWLLKQQYKERHPYTGAAPGGWAWTPLPGGVPDADDTPGALLALESFHEDVVSVPFPAAVRAGLGWLVSLENDDGGWPTFCRGWLKQPFDRSGADLTAHALRAILRWLRHSPSGTLQHMLAELTADCKDWLPGGSKWAAHRLQDGLKFLLETQRPDGSWLPLWFGNQHAPDDINPTYGTARVLAAYRDLDMMSSDPARRAVAWLLSVQNADGGWGGAANTPSSVEETALAVEVLLDAEKGVDTTGALSDAVNKGLAWLVQRVESGGLHDPTPIGFYFAKLWYFERLYPIIFSVAALGRARAKLSPAP
jgi:squalene-hopene/tetraprenyl-beta-curcumene cyclase